MIRESFLMSTASSSLEDGCLHEGAERPLAVSGLPSLAVGKY